MLQETRAWILYQEFCRRTPFVAAFPRLGRIQGREIRKKFASKVILSLEYLE